MDRSLTLLQLQSSFGDKMSRVIVFCFFAVVLGLTSCHLRKTGKIKKPKNRACIGPFENRAQMDSASSAESWRGVVLAVLRTRAVYQCSTLLTMRVLYSQYNRSYCVLLKYVGVHYSSGYYPYLQYLGFYIAYSARTVSNSAVNVDNASSIRSSKLLSKAPIICGGRSMQGESAKNRLFSFLPSDKNHDWTCAHGTHDFSNVNEQL